MQDAKKGKQQSITPEDIQSLRLGIVRARFNEDVTQALLYACMAELMQMGLKPQNITLMTVPGALEVPVALQTLAKQHDQPDALIALGCIIRGETYHFELVANESGAGITRVALDHNLPIANAILTVENMEQAVARQSEKGADAARVAVEMALLLRDKR